MAKLEGPGLYVFGTYSPGEDGAMKIDPEYIPDRQTQAHMDELDKAIETSRATLRATDESVAKLRRIARQKGTIGRIRKAISTPPAGIDVRELREELAASRAKH